MFILQVFISSENHPMSESQGELLGEYPGEFPSGVSIDFTHLEDFLPGRWVTIVDESKKPIILSDIRVYGSKGSLSLPLSMNFWKSSKGGGGVISDPKNFVAKFLAFETPIWGGHFCSKNFRSKKSQHFSQKRGRGGGSKAVWNFSKKSSIMVQTGFPYDDDNTIQLSYSTSHHSTFSKFERNEQEAGA